MTHSKDFVFWQMAYNYGWANKEQLKLVVSMNALTPAEYEEITGEVYEG